MFTQALCMFTHDLFYFFLFLFFGNFLGIKTVSLRKYIIIIITIVFICRRRPMRINWIFRKLNFKLLFSEKFLFTPSIYIKTSSLCLINKIKPFFIIILIFEKCSKFNFKKITTVSWAIKFLLQNSRYVLSGKKFCYHLLLCFIFVFEIWLSFKHNFTS